MQYMNATKPKSKVAQELPYLSCTPKAAPHRHLYRNSNTQLLQLRKKINPRACMIRSSSVSDPVNYLKIQASKDYDRNVYTSTCLMIPTPYQPRPMLMLPRQYMRDYGPGCTCVGTSSIYIISQGFRVLEEEKEGRREEEKEGMKEKRKRRREGKQEEEAAAEEEMSQRREFEDEKKKIRTTARVSGVSFLMLITHTTCVV
ncbi:hypothetical protein M9H77_08676 [Catharanthus roseus]|uniref:Uncharacterized protein n=1 Tax=Catharanthus roseus TaxID=4058 RepID=A0ACC0BYV4_CATRO|nr:hypothetical protein M9H77_08676 [Catharanthus roseus]